MGNSTSSTSSGSQSFERFDRSKGTVREQFYTRDRDQALERRNFHREQYRNERNTVIENCLPYTAGAAAVSVLGGPAGAAYTAGVAGLGNSHHIIKAGYHELKAGQAQKEADFADKVLGNSQSNK